jgi:hypothetical protein
MTRHDLITLAIRSLSLRITGRYAQSLVGVDTQAHLCLPNPVNRASLVSNRRQNALTTALRMHPRSGSSISQISKSP